MSTRHFMKEIVFVTHNKGKIKAAEKYFKNIKLKAYEYELDEPRSDDIKVIAESKVREAYNIVKCPCIAMDSDFRIEELNGFPRAFVNFALETIGVDGILKLMDGKENRKCAFNECLAYFDGNDIKYFFGKHEGHLSTEIRGIDRIEKWSNLWNIFIPSGYTKTLAEMDDLERNNREKINSYSAMEEFSKWYEEKEN